MRSVTWRVLFVSHCTQI